MQSIIGQILSGNGYLVSTSIVLAGMDDGGYYQVGDDVKGEIKIIPRKDIKVHRLFLSLEYVLESSARSSMRHQTSLKLEENANLNGDTERTIPFHLPVELHQPSADGVHLKGYWRITIRLHYDLVDGSPDSLLGLQGAFRVQKPQVSTFPFPVRFGQGNYVVQKSYLPIELVNVRTILLGGLVLFLVAVAGLVLREYGLLTSAYINGAPLVILLVLLAGHYLRLTVFQMVPMEIAPLRDGQLRLRILDRGNDHLDQAVVGYRVVEACMDYRNEANSSFARTALLERTFSLKDLMVRKGQFLEAVLPWPDQQVPTNFSYDRNGFEWEFFLRLPKTNLLLSPEMSWPITVGWEPFKLPKKQAKSLELPLLAKEEIRLNA